ncbi:MAG TPA: DUF3237 domain-containing protein, partial [Prolixibacteraceae bacterium]|nr:DUF3237 domain-containing protein [Prolixibacteraceae bacterium]
MKYNMSRMNRFIVLFILVLGFYNAVFAQEFVPPELEFICELKVSIDPALELGETARGKRVIIPINGGTFEGPKMKGVVLRGGADYQYVNSELGRTELEAIYSIKTDDDVLIHVRNIGIIYNPKEDKISSDANSRASYFRAAPKFEAPVDSKYAWLNN